MNWKLSLMLTGIGAPLALAGAVVAQPTPPPPPAAGPHEMRMQHPDPAGMAEKHAQHLRDILQLRPEQEGALRAMIESMTPPAGMTDRMGRGHDEDAHLPTPQRLDRMLAQMDERRAMMVRHAEAVKRFYAQLSPGQQKAFDTLHAGGMGHHMGMDGGGHRMMFMRRMGPGGMDHPGMEGPDEPDGPAHD